MLRARVKLTYKLIEKARTFLALFWHFENENLALRKKADLATLNQRLIVGKQMAIGRNTVYGFSTRESLLIFFYGKSNLYSREYKRVTHLRCRDSSDAGSRSATGALA
ncbi:hypothetical protein PoB_001041700 [Plakobranchus ocellatus]|uniref:Uncharacterized protein n=1 Tax=Plakobranchus ocellatus TaxID=259542 RepID=A0AAV3YLW3_9GAST|nr:hypothetical protein PoB_001041700 [Plakobranchus ocellatus]